ncbi:MAG: sigma-70 family RNA polymerase sigma factor [Planctomycetota bacterium]
MNNPGPGDERLMKLFLRNEAVLRAYARTMLPDLNSVDDVLQEAYLTMYDKFDQLRNEEGFLPWGKVIVRFKCLSQASKLRRVRPVLSDEALQAVAEVAEETDMDDMNDLREALESCLKELPRGKQELVLAPYSGDGQVKRMAVQTGKSPSALYMMLIRLREKLGKCVKSKVQTAGGLS